MLKTLNFDEQCNFYITETDGNVVTLGTLRVATGVCDSNGNMIYNDSIILYKPSWNKNEELICSIKFINGGFAIVTKTGYQYLWTIDVSKETLIVQNI